MQFHNIAWAKIRCPCGFSSTCESLGGRIPPHRVGAGSGLCRLSMLLHCSWILYTVGRAAQTSMLLLWPHKWYNNMNCSEFCFASRAVLDSKTILDLQESVQVIWECLFIHQRYWIMSCREARVKLRLDIAKDLSWKSEENIKILFKWTNYLNSSCMCAVRHIAVWWSWCNSELNLQNIRSDSVT